METANYKELVSELAMALIKARLAGEHLSYSNSIQVIGSLLMATLDKDCTRHIFMAVLNQAIELGKTYVWVEYELHFEVMATTFNGSRHDAMAYNLKQVPVIDDRVLDLYNERLKRFRPDNNGILIKR